MSHGEELHYREMAKRKALWALAVGADAELTQLPRCH